MEQKEFDPRPDLAYSRTHLSNQRTYAAWLRTGLSMGAAGFAIVKLVPTFEAERPTAWGVGVAFMVIGATMIGFGAWSFRRIANTLAAACSPPPGFTTAIVYTSAGAVIALTVATLFLI